MAKPQLPAKAWLLEGYHEWYKENVYAVNFAEIDNISDVVVIKDEGHSGWYCSWGQGGGATVPKQFIEFKPPVCPKCEGSGYQTIQQLNSCMRVAKKCDCQ